MTITVAAEPFDSPDGRRLVAALDAEMSSRYLPAQMFGRNLRAEHLEAGAGTFLIARAEGLAIGCGAVRRLDETTVEVKRMFVEEERRGQGVAKEILKQLAAAARAMGAQRLVLETGVYQTEAIGLYQKAGFRPISCFGDYASSPTSLCFEKKL